MKHNWELFVKPESPVLSKNLNKLISKIVLRYDIEEYISSVISTFRPVIVSIKSKPGDGGISYKT